MKSFIITLIFFALILVLVPMCAFYADTVITQTESLALSAYQNSTSEEVLSRLILYWESNQRLLSLFISFDELDKVTESLLVFKANAESKNLDMLSQSYQTLKNALDNIHRFEVPCFEGVF